MTNRDKAKWLMHHYKDYSLKWYLEDSARLNGIFKREYYDKYLRNENKQIIQAEKDEMVEKVDIMKSVYFEYYGSDYDSDFRNNRPETLRKSMAISNRWLHKIA